MAENKTKVTRSVPLHLSRGLRGSAAKGLPRAGFSPRRQELVLYLGPGLENKNLMAKLGKHKAGKGCLYVKTLDDIDRTVLRALVAESVAAMRQRYPRD
jgi:hypothetical protein